VKHKPSFHQYMLHKQPEDHSISYIAIEVYLRQIRTYHLLKAYQ